MNSPSILQAQLKTAQANTQPKFLIELAKPSKAKIVFKVFPTLQKNASHSQQKMKQKLNIYNGLQRRRTERHHLTAV